MKKSLLLVFCAAILFCATNASAQSFQQSSTTTTLDANGMVHTLAGGEWNVTIVVTDIQSNPIQGALIAAPCTGLANRYTDAHGKAIYNGSGVCPCSKASVHVTTPGCDKYITVNSCGTTNVVCP